MSRRPNYSLTAKFAKEMDGRHLMPEKIIVTVDEAIGRLLSPLLVSVRQ